MKSFLKTIALSCSLLVGLSSCSTPSYVDQNGQLSTKDTKIVNSKGESIQLKGMSLFWSNWSGEFYTYNTIKYLRDEWNCTVIRVPLGTMGNEEGAGYIDAPEVERAKMDIVIKAAIDLGIYVIVDWHSHHAENETEEAKLFFEDIAKTYGSHPNIIYELYNEPMKVSWDTVVKPYLEAVIPVIRKHDANNIIICGSPSWAQDVDIVAKNPITDYDNIAYSVHYYAATHKQYLRDKMEVAMDAGLTLFITEFGTCNHLGQDPIDKASTQEWFDFLDKHEIGWANWSVNDKEEAASAFKPSTKTYGWTLDEFTESGTIIYNELNKTK